MFASRNLVEHLARGVVGVGAFVGATLLMESHPWIALSLIPVALVALRGCPMCWAVGLFETLSARLQGRPAVGGCSTGRCALPGLPKRPTPS